MVHCTIDWSPMSADAWDDAFKSIRRSTLLQHFPYAQANRATNQTGAKHGKILIDEVPAGLVQVSEVGVLRNMFHAVSLDRGPLWFAGYGSPEHVAAFFSCFAEQFPKRLGRKLRVLPEAKDNTPNRLAMEKAGYARRDEVPGYETIWLALDEDTESLRAGLNGKWRNILSKSERSALTVSEDWSGATSAHFLTTYEADRTEKGYEGPSVKLLVQLLKHMIPRQEAVIFNAKDQDEVVAAILVFLHGSSATYQVGWTTGAGRKLGAHHQLLWRAVVQLKQKGVLDFDLGGINDDGAAGVKKFKQGLGGKEVRLVGFFN
ncbi:MAG: GNAT family N-acetyltransferase [Rhizobiales bacterium]|nr:GNAT family N-acetyltransferase [Hyphomicrobiales bacterium]